MFLIVVYSVYFICFGSTNVQAEFRQATINVLPSTMVSNVDCTTSARSLADCTTLCMNECENCTAATYNTENNTCLMSAHDAISVVQNNDFITITSNHGGEGAVSPGQYGTHFVTGFLTNGIYNEGTPQLMIVSSVQTPTNVWVNIPYLNISQEHHVVNGHLFLEYSNSLMPTLSTVTTQNAVEVTADQPVALFSMNYNSGSADGTIEIPTNNLGNAYIVDTHNSTTWGTGVILVMAVFNDTEVTLDLPWGATETIMVDRYETYQRKADGTEQLAGTLVSANATIAVHAGHVCANVPDDTVVYCDILVTSVPPVATLGHVFIIPYQKPRPNYSIGVAAPYNGTGVTVCDKDGVEIQTYQLDKGDTIFRSFSSSKLISITSTDAILVTQYGHGGNCLFGDPSLSVIPATSQYGNQYTFAVPSETIDPSVLSVVIESKYGPAGLILNGSPIGITESLMVFVPEEGASYHVLYADVNKNVTYMLHHANPSARFAAWYFARSACEEYTTVLGYNF